MVGKVAGEKKEIKLKIALFLGLLTHTVSTKSGMQSTPLITRNVPSIDRYGQLNSRAMKLSLSMRVARDFFCGSFIKYSASLH